jgi:hypothetical protein
MSPEPRRCPACGADAPRLEARFCEHCGARLASAPATEPAPPPADPFGDVPARFRALSEHAELPGLLRAAPAVPELSGATLPSLLLLLLLAVLGFFAALLCFQLCPPLGFAPLALVAIGVVVLARQMIWTARTPLRACPAMVYELRTKLQAGAEHSPAHARHLALLQLEGGERVEHECFVSAVAGLEPGALGVAYLKGERLAAFARLPV